MITRVKLLGDDKLRAKFRAMTKDAASVSPSGPLRVAVRAGCEVIRTDAARRAPYKTGTLRRSIHTEVL